MFWREMKDRRGEDLQKYTKNEFSPSQTYLIGFLFFPILGHAEGNLTSLFAD